MVVTVNPASSAVEAQSPIQPQLGSVTAGGHVPPMSVRLKGRWVDIKAVTDHWGIDIDWRSEQAILRIHDECVVDGTLKVRV